VINTDAISVALAKYPGIVDSLISGPFFSYFDFFRMTCDWRCNFEFALLNLEKISREPFLSADV